MVRISYEQKPFRRSMIQLWGAEIVASPSERHAVGPRDPRGAPRHAGQPRDRDLGGGRGRGAAATTPSYSLGSVLNHVLLHQTVIGQEAIAQMELAGAFPDVVDRLRRRRLELRRACVPVHPREDRRPRHRRARVRARGVPDADPRPLRVRLRRHEQADAARPDAHARARLRPGPDPRGRPSLPRRRAADLAAREGRPDPRRGLPPE